MLRNLDDHFKYFLLVLCAVGAVSSFIPTIFNIDLVGELQFAESDSPASSLKIEKCNVAMVAISALMLFDSMADLVSKPPLPLEVSIPRWVMIAGLFCSSIAFETVKTNSAMDKLVLLLNCYYMRKFSILAPIVFVVCGDLNLKSKLVRINQLLLSALLFICMAFYTFYPFLTDRSNIVLTFGLTVGLLELIETMLVCGYSIFNYYNKENYQSGMEKFSILHTCLCVLFINSSVILSICFGSHAWGATESNELMGYFIIELITMITLHILPSRMARYEGNLAMVSTIRQRLRRHAIIVNSYTLRIIIIIICLFLSGTIIN